MKITTTDRNILIEYVNGTVTAYAFNSLSPKINGGYISFELWGKWLVDVRIEDVTINGTQLTPENFKDLTSALFF